MTAREKVAEAIRREYTNVVFGETNEEAWERLAQAAIDAMGLKQECAYAGDPWGDGEELMEWSCGHLRVYAQHFGPDCEDYDIPVTRLVTPWVKEES